MALTEKEVLSTAGGLVDEYITGLPQKGMTLKRYIVDLTNMRRVLEEAIKIIDTIIQQKNDKTYH